VRMMRFGGPAVLVPGEARDPEPDAGQVMLDSAGVGEGERVLVEAAGGGVGSLLVQLARARGATVVAAAGDSRKRELAADLGAEVTVDYRDDRWARTSAVEREGWTWCSPLIESRRALGKTLLEVR
jgi:NADPH:quinone reductase-like Zn-dependent oxidoreductase